MYVAPLCMIAEDVDRHNLGKSCCLPPGGTALSRSRLDVEAGDVCVTHLHVALRLLDMLRYFALDSRAPIRQEVAPAAAAGLSMTVAVLALPFGLVHLQL